MENYSSQPSGYSSGAKLGASPPVSMNLSAMTSEYQERLNRLSGLISQASACADRLSGAVPTEVNSKSEALLDKAPHVVLIAQHNRTFVNLLGELENQLARIDRAL